MKKLLFIMCCLLIMPSVCNAELLDNFKELRYRLEAGTNFRDYNTAYQDLYIAYRKANNDKYKELMDLYSSFRDVWDDQIQGNSMDNRANFYKKYHNQSCKQTLDQSAILSYICDTIKYAPKLEDKIKGVE